MYKNQEEITTMDNADIYYFNEFRHEIQKY